MTYTQITQPERYAIWALRTLGLKAAAIAREFGWHRTTIGRELRRNVWRENRVSYFPLRAQSYTNERRRVARRGSHVADAEWAFVEDLLREDWSPTQIEGWRARFAILAISHETIYRRIVTDRKQSGTLWTHLRVVTKKDRKRYGAYDSRGRLAGKRHISSRPLEAEHRTRRGAPGTTARLRQLIDAQPHHVRTLTLDNGTEFHAYKQLEAMVDTVCCFATPHHSWERGTNENANGLIRQFLKKGVSMGHLTQRSG